jgi:hypothetical protein
MGNQNVVFAFHQICKPASKLPAGCVQTSPDKFDICHVRASASERARPISPPPPTFLRSHFLPRPPPLSLSLSLSARAEGNLCCSKNPGRLTFTPRNRGIKPRYERSTLQPSRRIPTPSPARRMDAATISLHYQAYQINFSLSLPARS